MAASSSGLGLAKQVKGLFASAETGIISYTAIKTSIAVVVTERGQLESASSKDVFSKVEGTPQIIFIEPEGSTVKKDQLVVELDSAALQDNLTTQKIATRKAEAEYKQAKLTLEVSQISVQEYEKGTYPSDIQTADGELALAKSDLERAKDRKEWADRMLLQKLLSESQHLADVFALQKAEFTLKQATTKREVLEKYTYNKEMTELKANVKKAESDTLAKEQTYELEKSKEDKLVTQIKNCKLYAPIDGLVVYANEQNQFRGGQQGPQIELGASIRERQKIFSIPDITRMRVNAKVHESMIDQVRPDLPAKVKVESFADRDLHGSVQKVNTMPDATNMFSSGINVYTTFVSIDDALAGLRPGMTAEVSILVTQKDDIIAVPVQAIIQFKSKDHVYVMTPTGPSKRAVTLGLTNDKLIEVVRGVDVGESVALNPSALMTEDEKREAFAVTVRPAGQNWTNAEGAQAKEIPGSPGPITPAGKGAPQKGMGPAAKGGDAAKGDAAKGGMSKGAMGKGGMGKGGMGKGGMGKGAFDPEMARQKMRERGMSEEEIDARLEQFKNGGGFGGGGGGFGGGRRGQGGGPGGGGPGGGGDQGGPNQ
jgi:multidrug efflux pump subunit AcrA (membrane-fusion protein)